MSRSLKRMNNGTTRFSRKVTFSSEPGAGNRSRFSIKKGGIEMLPWWAALLLFIGGAVFGMFIATILIAEERDDRP